MKTLDNVQTWITQFVEVPHPLLNGFAPCPYARKARLDGHLGLYLTDKSSFEHTLAQASEEILDEKKSVGLLVFRDTSAWSYQEASKTVQALRVAGKSRDLYFLWDHPDRHEVVNGVSMNQGEYFLLFVQRLSKLQQATKDLQKTDYYKLWDPESLQQLMGSRFQA